MHSASSEAQAQTWAYFQANMAKYVAYLGEASSSLMDAAIGGSIRGFTTTERYNEVKAFFDANPCPRNARKIEQSLENIAISAKYRDMICAGGAVTEWLKAQ